MNGLVIFLVIILVLLAVTALTLVVVIIKVTLQIKHSQKNIEKIHKQIDDTMSLVSFASSIAALAGGLTAKVKHKKTKSRK